MQNRIDNKIALVTGASRGIGQGISLVLGEHGYTVYVTVRSTALHPGRPEWANATIDATAALVSRAGGIGIPIQCDHTDDVQVQRVYSQIKEQTGHLDLLVNVVWGGYEDMEGFREPFWKQPDWRLDKMYQAGVRTAYSATKLGARLMLDRRQGLIVNFTFTDDGKYLDPVPQDFALNAIARLSFATAQDLRPFEIASIALSPGFVRNEGILTTDELLSEYRRPPTLPSSPPPHSESTQYVGRAVAALASDPNVMSHSGKCLTVASLARAYGFTDIDGSQPPEYRIEWTD